MKQSIDNRLQMIRDWMLRYPEPIDALLIPTMDPHNSEYVAEHWQMRRWLTAFTGSAGMALVTQTEALLWTDSRYWIQAEQQLRGSSFLLMRDGVDISPQQWLVMHVTGNVAFPEDMMVPSLYCEFFSAHNAIAIPANALDTIWTDRPALPLTPAEIVPAAIAGEDVSTRLTRVQHWLIEQKCESLFISDLSEIGWLLNLRANDIPFNPFLISFLKVVRKGMHTLYVHAEQITTPVAAMLQEVGIQLAPYHEGLALRLQMLGSPEPENPIAMMKALKNPMEQEGFRQAHLRDGIAMVQFLRQLDEMQGVGWTERSADAQLTTLRAAQPGFKGLSFETIAAYGSHAAIVHYEPTPESDIPLESVNGKGSLFLLDSGAHYDCGTTDITRTIALGEVSHEEKQAYTLVLKGHLQLQHMAFPEGTTGLQLDTAARMAMWRCGYDFGHGTGHGVGFRLGVHEGPVQIRKNYRACTVLPLCAGQVITNEPGIYKAHEYGVRIENMMLCTPKSQTEFGSFLSFEPLTMCPYDVRPILVEMLSTEELQWLNAYHQKVWHTLSPLLPHEADRKWLYQATRPLSHP